jgi:hypothetical protein
MESAAHKGVLESKPPISHIWILFGNMIIADVIIYMRWSHTGEGWHPNPVGLLSLYDWLWENGEPYGTTCTDAEIGAMKLWTKGHQNLQPMPEFGKRQTDTCVSFIWVHSKCHHNLRLRSYTKQWED